MRTGALLIVLAGCSIPQRAPFDCVGVVLPPQVPATIHVHGNVLDYVKRVPISGATETPFVILGGGPPVQRFPGDTTNSEGLFHWDEPVAMEAPFEHYIQSQVAGYHDTFFYTALPVASDLFVTLGQFDQQGLESLAGSCLPMPCSPNTLTAPVFVSVVDCNDDAVGGATVTVTQASNDTVQVIYLKGDVPDRGAHQTDTARGTALVTGLVQGSATVRATFEDIPYKPHDVTVTTGAVTFTEVSP
jgi:hypothetical protein